MRYWNSRLLAALVLPVALVVCSKPVNRPPDDPAIPTGPSFGRSDSTYAFTTAAVDPDGDSISYWFEWGDTTQSEWSPFVPSGIAWRELKTWTVPGVFQIRVRAQDNHGQRSGLSRGLKVSIANLAPLRPAAPAGPDTAGGGQTCVFDDSTQDPNGDSMAYEFDWGDGDSAEWTAFVPSGTVIMAGHFWLSRGSYLIRVRAKDGLGAVSDWSETHLIRVSGPTLRWRFHVGGMNNYSSPAVGTDGTAYLTGQGDDIFAVNPDGSIKWRSRIPGDADGSVVVGQDGTTYLNAGSYLYAVRPDGALDWRLDIGDASTRNGLALFADSTILCRAGGLSSVSKAGTIRWVCRTGTGGSFPAVGADGAIYFQSNDSVYALNPDSSVRWRRQFLSSRYTSPVIGINGTVCLIGFNGLTAFDQAGDSLWSVNVGDGYPDIRSTPSVGAEGTVYCGCGRGLQAVSADGTKGWLFPTSKEVRTSPAVAEDGTIYFTCEDAFLYALNSDGSLKWRYHIHGLTTRSSPAIAPDGAVYVTSRDGYLYAFEGTAPLASSPWPMYLHDTRHTGWAGTQ
jgi:outer membrane protein assembly factor BamB